MTEPLMPEMRVAQQDKARKSEILESLFSQEQFRREYAGGGEKLVSVSSSMQYVLKEEKGWSDDQIKENEEYRQLEECMVYQALADWKDILSEYASSAGSTHVLEDLYHETLKLIRKIEDHYPEMAKYFFALKDRLDSEGGEELTREDAQKMIIRLEEMLANDLPPDAKDAYYAFAERGGFSREALFRENITSQFFLLVSSPAANYPEKLPEEYLLLCNEWLAMKDQWPISEFMHKSSAIVDWAMAYRTEHPEFIFVGGHGNGLRRIRKARRFIDDGERMILKKPETGK